MMPPVIKPIYDAEGDHIDDIAKCGNCGSFICYPTELGARLHYRYCCHCGLAIDWKGGVNDETCKG